MALHPDNKLTPEIEAELRRVIDALPDNDLSALAHNDPAFQTGGFRAGNTAVLRARALQVAAGTPLISSSLRRALITHSLNRTLVGLLSLAVLTDLRNDLAALFGAPRFLLALLVDEREEVRDLAARWMRQETVFLTVDPATATARIHDIFARLVEAAGADVSAAATVPVTRETWKEAREQLEQQLRDTRAESRRLKGVDDRLARTRDQLTARERELTEAQTRLNELETMARTAVRERDAAKVELDRELRHREERLLAAVESRLAIEAGAWLAPARAVEAEAASTPAVTGDPLLARTAGALARQAAVDRHSGNRRVLTGRYELLTQQRADVRDALANALQPLPELVRMEAELSREIERLGALLNRGEGRVALEMLLAARMATAAPDELQNMHGLLQQLSALGVCEMQASVRLSGALENRLRVARAIALPANDVDEDDDTPTGILRRALGGKTPAILLIDGHNVLFGLQGRYFAPQGAAVPTSVSRTRLVDDVVRLTADRPTCRAWIVFDGPTHSESTPSANVRVAYSGGEGEHRADAALLDNIRFFRAGDEISVLLVTNDNDLSASARRLGALTLSALDFCAFL